jgi:preprotein translocase subunit SecA
MTKDAGALLGDLSNLYAQRNELYKDNYKNIGKIMELLFNGEVTLSSVGDYNRFGVIIQIISKLMRYTYNFNESDISPDYMDDLAVYSMILQELDNEWRKS